MINQTPLAAKKLYFRDYCYWISFFITTWSPPIHGSANAIHGYYSKRRIQGSNKYLRTSMDGVALSIDVDYPRMACNICSQDLSHLLSISINQPFLSYLSSGYEPGSQGIFIDEVFSLYCILAFIDLTYRLQVCCPPPVARGTTKCNVALLRILTIHQPATKCCLIPFNSWWNDNLMFTMICPASHYFDVNDVNCDA